MKICLTGAGGGHFYPLIAVAERVKEKANQENISDLKFYFMSDKPYNQNLLDENNIKFIFIPAGKLTLYFSFQKIFAPIISFFGFLKALIYLFSIYPDVLFVKGGYASLPVALAAKILFIPIFLHESDSVPGRTNLIISKLAKRIAVSYAVCIKYFSFTKTAYIGQPILKEYTADEKILNQKLENLNIEFKQNVKRNILIVGGSQGAEIINKIILECLYDLLPFYNIYHQVGENNFKNMSISTEILLKKFPEKDSYKFFGNEDLKKYYEVADICITRAGSSLFEIQNFGIPMIIVPITNSNGNHQRENAYIFQKAGCAIVLEEENLSKNILINNLKSILENQNEWLRYRENNLNAFKKDAAEKIAEEILRIVFSHR